MYKTITKEKKKLIFSSYDDIHNPFYGGGGALAIHQIVRRLSLIFDVVVLTGNYKGAKNKREENVLYKRIGPTFLGPQISQLVFTFLLPFYVRKEKFDIWVESFTPPFSTTCLQLFTKKPVIGLVHMLAGADMERKYKLPFRFIEEKGLKMYKHFIVVRETTRKIIARINKNAQIYVIPNGVNEAQTFKSQTKKEYILFVGRLEFNQKGLDLLIKAYRYIASKTTKKLIIAGSGSPQDEQKIKKMIHEYGLEKRILLVGKVSGEKKAMLFDKCELVVIPSRYETFSMVALEAMSYGKPIVTFAISGLDWLTYGCALQVKPFDIEKFGNTIYRILESKYLRNKMAKAGRKAVLQYSWEKVSDAYKNTFISILQSL
jgi:glycosyltransferase involved in cell wall biosynthesis